MPTPRPRARRAVLPHFPLLLLLLLAPLGGCDQGEDDPAQEACAAAPAGANASLTSGDVASVIARAASEALAIGQRATIAVVDHEGNVLGVFRMDGAAGTTRFEGGGGGALEEVVREVDSRLAAVSKAITASYLSSQGHAFNSRTASFIVQEHFPPQVEFSSSGPLFGVQFSQLPCNDISRRLAGNGEQTSRNTMMRAPIGLSADPGSVPLYKDGVAVGGIGVEGDGLYTLDPDPTDLDRPWEEQVAFAGAGELQPPRCIWGDQIVVNGIRFAFLNATTTTGAATVPFDQLPGRVVELPGFFNGRLLDSPPSRYFLASLGTARGRQTTTFPFRAGQALTRDEVVTIVRQAAETAQRTRAAIRRPIGDEVHVSIHVVDLDGSVLGSWRTLDAPPFGFDVSVQKARAALLFSRPDAAARVRAAFRRTDDLRSPNARTAAALFAGAGSDYVEAASRDGLLLDGSIAFSNRAVGFLARPFYPDGLNVPGTLHGPFSKPFGLWSVFNTGIQLDIVAVRVVDVLAGQEPDRCAGDDAIANGFQIFPGSVPLYKGGVLAGAIGISGDGVDQDDLVAASGAVGFQELGGVRRSDEVFVRGVRLPYVKFPANPDR